MTRYPTNHLPRDPWIEFELDAQRHTDDAHEDVLPCIDTNGDEYLTLEEFGQYQLEAERSSQVSLEKSQFGKKWRTHTYQNTQRQAQLYNAIYDLPGEHLKNKFSLFLTLAIMQQQHSDQLSLCRQAIAEDQLNPVIKQLDAIYSRYQWSFSEKALLTELSSKFTLTPFNQALTYLVQHYSAANSHISLYADLLAFCRKFAEAFELFDLHTDLKRLIHHFIDPNALERDFVVHDGCAGIGLLTQGMHYPTDHNPSKSVLETDDPLLLQIGQQLYLLNQGVNKTHDLDYKLNLGLDGKAGVNHGIADLYISFPKIPCNLKRQQREPVHAFRNVNYRGPIPSFACDAIWVQYALYSLNDHGQGFVVVQDGFLRRSGYDAAVREYLIRNNLLVAVISLHAEHARESQYSQLSLLVLNKARPKQSEDNSVYFYYLRNLPAELGAASIDDLKPTYDWAMHPWVGSHQQAFYKQQQNIGTVDFYKTQTELANDNYNLSFEHYLGFERKADYPKLSEIEADYQSSMQKLIGDLAEFNKPWY